MPSDVSVEIASRPSEGRTTTRLPVGVGLGIGALASVTLWTCIAFGLRALFA
jgi:hypothetical protein